MNVLMILILWTWGITPLWVNIAGTCICGFRWVIQFLKAVLETVND